MGRIRERSVIREYSGKMEIRRFDLARDPLPSVARLREDGSCVADLFYTLFSILYRVSIYLFTKVIDKNDKMYKVKIAI